MSFRYILFVTLLGVVSLGPAQDLAMKFGTVSKGEMQLTSYENDPETEAVVLFDKGESYFKDADDGFVIHFSRTRRIKILKEAGIKHGEIRIPYAADVSGRIESIKAIKGYSYNIENGQIVKKALDPRTVFVERINKNWNVKKFVFPDVKKGTVIEYAYELETSNLFNLPDWKFQDRIPTRYSEYVVKTIPFYDYIFIARGITRFTQRKSERVSGPLRNFFGTEFKEMVHTYVMEDVPAFKEESFISSPNDYLIQMDFQLSKIHDPTWGTKEFMTSWPRLNKRLLNEFGFGKYIKQCEKWAQIIIKDELELEHKHDIEKAKLIIEYVKSAYSWNGNYAMFASKTPKEFYRQKTGNSADVNLFLIALLRAANIQSEPVIISTRDHGKINSNYPFAHFFNYAITFVSIGTHSFLADGTESLVPYDHIPPRCINDKGLIVREGAETWVSLASKINSLNKKSILLEIDPLSLNAHAHVSVQTTGFESYAYKNRFKDNTDKLSQYFLSNGITVLSNIQTFQYNQSHKPYIISLEGEIGLERIDEKLVVSPFLDFPIKENELTQKERSYPIDFVYPKTEIISSLLNIPKGYKVLTVPEDFILDNELVKIQVEFKQYDNAIEAQGKYMFKQAVYHPADYTKIKESFDLIIEKYNEQIVFENI